MGLVGAALALLVAANGLAFRPPQSDLEARRKALRSLLTEQWEYTLTHEPGIRVDHRRQALERQNQRRFPRGHPEETWRRPEISSRASRRSTRRASPSRKP